MSPTATTVRSRGAAAPARPRHEPAAAPTRRHLRPVPQPAPARSTRRRVRPHVALTMAILTFFVILFGVALLQTVLVQGQIHLDGVRADAAERATEVQVARARVATLESPENIVDLARELGMTEVPVHYLPSVVPDTP
ncbi:MAG TPA: hypothetical protein VD926_11140 [Acidimicrobiales bacterium]|nr:hypothetical protein [Acidimicrobiales bacterium]